ncbi:hypothetical protein ACW7BJ_33485 [Azospirillum argentinense]
MTGIPKPPSRVNRKGPPPAENDVPNALFAPVPEAPSAVPAEPKATRPTRDTPMNFRVAKALKRRFTQRAFDLEVDGVELLEAMIELYLEDERLAATVQGRAKA